MTGSKLIDNVLVGLMLLVSAAVAGLFFYNLNIYEKPLPNGNAELNSLLTDSKKLAFTEAYKVDKLIINLKSRTSRLRFLDIETFIVPFKQDNRTVLEENKTIINDIIIDEASRILPEELNTLSGKLIFEGRLKKGINARLKKNIVKDIFFSKFVVQ